MPAAAASLLPPEPQPRSKRTFTLYLEGGLVDRLSAITKASRLASRNALVVHLIEVGAELATRLASSSAAISAFARTERISQTEALAQLIERGLKQR